MDAVMLYSVWPSPDLAQACARALVEQRLAACANILPGVTSVFLWEGAIQTESEAVMIVKTSSVRAAAARDMIAAIHPYELPAIVGIAVEGDVSSHEFVAWIENQTN